MNAKKGIYNIVFGILGQALTVVFAIIVPIDSMPCPPEPEIIKFLIICNVLKYF